RFRLVGRVRGTPEPKGSNGKSDNRDEFNFGEDRAFAALLRNWRPTGGFGQLCTILSVLEWQWSIFSWLFVDLRAPVFRRYFSCPFVLLSTRRPGDQGTTAKVGPCLCGNSYRANPFPTNKKADGFG